MLRALAAYLIVFWLLGLAVHLGGFIHLLAGAALTLLAVDQLKTSSASPHRHRADSRQFLNQRPSPKS